LFFSHKPFYGWLIRLDVKRVLFFGFLMRSLVH
jgi:hypothetical protein